MSIIQRIYDCYILIFGLSVLLLLFDFCESDSRWLLLQFYIQKFHKTPQKFHKTPLIIDIFNQMCYDIFTEVFL